MEGRSNDTASERRNTEWENPVNSRSGSTTGERVSTKNLNLAPNRNYEVSITTVQKTVFQDSNHGY